MSTVTFRTSDFSRPGVDILVNSVRKTYRVGSEQYVALNGVSFAIKRGRVTVIQGPSGCGKSTLLNILGGVDYPDEGTVDVGNNALALDQGEKRMADFRLREVGFIFQAYNLIPGISATNNLILPMLAVGMEMDKAADRARVLLELVGMQEKCQKRPDELSGGEQQRVAAALALVNDPPVILADEPTGNLDAENARKVVSLLTELAHNFSKTVLITTHDPLVSEQCDEIRFMRDGILQT